MNKQLVTYNSDYNMNQEWSFDAFKICAISWKLCRLQSLEYLLSKCGQRWCAVQCHAADQLWFMSMVVL